MSELLRLEGVNVYYDMIHAVKDVSLTVARGEIVTLIGANGAGKSTTLQTISGLIKASSGRIFYDGTDITRASVSELVRKGISLVPEGREVFPEFSVEDNLRLGAYTRKDRKEIEESFSFVYSLFPRLSERKGQSAKTLSGGEQQMLAIGRALMAKPELLLLDEPSLGLSPTLVEAIFSLIKDINSRGVTILLIEQNAKMALRISDRGYVLETGRVVLEGTGQALLSDDDIRKAYLGQMRDNDKQ